MVGRACMRQDLSPFMFGSGVTLVVCTVLAWSGSGSPLFTITVEAPDTYSENGLSRDAAYQASVAAAAVAVFGYAAVTVIRRISKSDPLSVKRDNIMVLVGPFAFAGTHIYFAAWMCCVDPAPYLPALAVASVVFLAMPVIGLIGILKRKPEDQE